MAEAITESILSSFSASEKLSEGQNHSATISFHLTDLRMVDVGMKKKLLLESVVRTKASHPYLYSVAMIDDGSG